LAGEFEDSISHKFNWNEEFRNQFQEWRRYRDHDTLCFNNYENRIEGPVNYPAKFVEYVPEDYCKAVEGAAGQVILTPFTTIFMCILASTITLFN